MTTKQIDHVWTPSFIAKSYESVDLPSIDYVDHTQRVQACWRNAQEKAKQLIQALTVWANEKGVYGGPDASHLAGIIQDVCADADMYVEEWREYWAAKQDAKELGKMLRAMLDNLREHKDWARALECVEDATRFSKDAKDAYFNYACE